MRKYFSSSLKTARCCHATSMQMSVRRKVWYCSNIKSIWTMLIQKTNPKKYYSSIPLQTNSSLQSCWWKTNTSHLSRHWTPWNQTTNVNSYSIFNASCVSLLTSASSVRDRQDCIFLRRIWLSMRCRIRIWSRGWKILWIHGTSKLQMKWAQKIRNI